jgi:hypothetical protein
MWKAEETSGGKILARERNTSLERGDLEEEGHVFENKGEKEEKDMTWRQVEDRGAVVEGEKGAGYVKIQVERDRVEETCQREVKVVCG